MKALLVTALAALIFAVPAYGGFSDGGDGPLSMGDGGGSAYCQASMQGQTGYIHGWPVRCQVTYVYGGFYDPYYGNMFGCPNYFGCYAWMRY